jgi:8-oxo-dGTP pyrophosphatase MutT (NUDIX family)
MSLGPSKEAPISLAKLLKDPLNFPFEPAGDGLAAIASDELTATAIESAFSLNRPWTPELTGDQFRLGSAALRPAAVMLALLSSDDGMQLLLTRRTANLREHSGQIALPGGRVDATDASAQAAALREAFEEVGLLPHSVKVLGQLNQYVTGTGFDIAPVVGLVNEVFVAVPSPAEVSEVFQVPLIFLMDPNNHRRHVVEIPETATNEAGKRTFYSMMYNNYFIWGATAAMLRNFYHMLAAQNSMTIQRRHD